MFKTKSECNGTKKAKLQLKIMVYEMLEPMEAYLHTHKNQYVTVFIPSLKNEKLPGPMRKAYSTYM
jgi:hypothetical protein